jgi:outer membrane protein OmpA-like peptidoglycan-associated protein/opacity protein-like surface antigen
MTLSWRLFAMLAVAVLLVPALRADDKEKTLANPNGEGAVNSTVAPDTADAEALPTAPTPAPKRKSSGGKDTNTPRVELFVGYSFWRALPAYDVNRIAWMHGGSASLAINLNNWLGLVGDFGGYGASRFSPEPGSGVVSADGTVLSYLFGPRFSLRKSSRITPFAQALFGAAHASPVTLSGCAGVGCTPLLSENTFAMTAGGGVDLKLHRHIAIRLFQAEYLMTRFEDISTNTGDRTIQNNMRLSTGLVFSFGSMGPPPPPPAATCSSEPADVFAGEPVTGTAAGSNFNPKRMIRYNWSGTGVKVTGTNASTQIDTTGLQPGPYEISANVSDGSKNGVASCMARFNVKQPRPPVIACSSDPGSVKTGGSATIRSSASSPDARRLSYSYGASAGNISGEDATATLDSQGAQPGPITVTCNVSDDRNLTASSTTVVNVEAPPPPPPPAPAPRIKELETKLALHSIYFATAQPIASKPKGGLLPSQEQILLTMAQDFEEYLKYKPEAHLILGAHADARGSAEYNKALTQRRLVRATNALVENGVPADHIDAQSFGDENQLTADQIKEQIADNPELTPDDRRQMLGNLQVMVLANNRRIDVSLSTNGQQSTRRYPFNAKDFLALINTKNVEKKSKDVGKKAPVKK